MVSIEMFVALNLGEKFYFYWMYLNTSKPQIKPYLAIVLITSDFKFDTNNHAK